MPGSLALPPGELGLRIGERDRAEQSRGEIGRDRARCRPGRVACVRHSTATGIGANSSAAESKADRADELANVVGRLRVCETRRVPLRAAAICGLLAPVTFVVGLMLGDLAQPDAFSPANDDISDLGAQTADQAWIYNQIAANLNGLLVVAFAFGLWRALGSGWPARLGVLGLAVLGMTRFLEGFLRLDCRGMDDGCENTSRQADAHGIESGIASALFFVVPPVLGFAFRRLPQWHDLWLPTLLAVPVVVAVSVLFSVIGDGAAVRAASITWFIWLGLLAWRLLRTDERR
jgi:hypothetical protein